jgi:hypothetical protein
MPTPTLVTWKIIGERPLFQSNPASMWAEPEEEGKTKRAAKQPLYAGKAKAFQVAESQLYVNEDGRYFHPCIAFYKCLEKACAKRNLDRSSALSIVVNAVRTTEEEFVLLDPDTLDSKKPKPLPKKVWLVDKRRAVNHNKGDGVGIVAIRPKWIVWGGLLTLEVDADFFVAPKSSELKLVGLTELLNIGGHIFGVGVGRRRLYTIRNRQEIWSDMGMGRFSAVLKQ